MAYKALDVAEYIIWYENTQGRLTNNLRLAKQMYFLQVMFLAKQEKPCYNEKLIAWDFGPVVEEVYHEYLYYGCGVIPPDKFKNKINNREDEQLMNDMLDCMSKYSTSLQYKLLLNKTLGKMLIIALGIQTMKLVINQSQITIVVMEIKYEDTLS